MSLLALLMLLALAVDVTAWIPSPHCSPKDTPTCIRPRRRHATSNTGPVRRSAGSLNAISVSAARQLGAVSSCVAVALTLVPSVARAESSTPPTRSLSSIVMADAKSNTLFQSNPLTNGILEQVRIWEQAEADNIRYGGELERGDAGNRGQVSAYPTLLVPILRMARDVDSIVVALTGIPTVDTYTTLERTLQQPVYETVAFKRIFNAFADNIYYSDPDRANLYLGGGALPKTEQSLAYLLRNEILGALQDLRAELAYLQRNSSDAEAQDDARRYATLAQDALRRYLQIVSPTELQVARDLLASPDAP